MIWKYIDRHDPSGCWLWTRGLDASGYGHGVDHGDRHHRVHRYVYESLIGPIPPGLTLDHDCHNADPSCKGGVTCLHRRCCNPFHLTPRTRVENSRRSPNSPAKWTACKAGHPYTEANTRWRRSGSGRSCRACHVRYGRDWRARKKEQR